MPENKEELFAMLYEFDSQIRAVHGVIHDYNGNDLTWREEYAMKCYETFLTSLEMSYDGIDHLLALELQNGES